MSDREKLIEAVEAVIDRAVNNSSRKEPQGYFFGSESKATATDILAALEASGVRLVPVEATLEMLYAGEVRMAESDVALISRKKRGEASASETVLDTLYSGDVYAAMLATSPYASQKDTTHEDEEPGQLAASSICDNCGWTGSLEQMHPFVDGNSTSYCCPMCGSTEVYEQPDDEDNDE